MPRFWLTAIFVGAAAQAAQPESCPPDTEGLVSPTRLMRATSLDLRGSLPSSDDYAQASFDGVPDDLFDAWLDGPEFTAQVVRHHRSLFWNNVTNVDLTESDIRLHDEAGVWYRDDETSEAYRGENDAHCGDFEATYDGAGVPIASYNATEGHMQEGWTWVSPYWDPAVPMKVCAYDATETAITSLGVDCATQAGERDPECGCGPELAWCTVSGISDTVAESFGTDLDLRVARIIDEDRSYLDLLTDDVGFVNGPMVHYYKHLSRNPDDVSFEELPFDLARLPELDWTDDGFQAVSQGTHHAGALTSAAWLLRFQTNRGRANRFYNDFLCQPFQPPDGGLTGLDNPNPTLDLTARDGCQYCHALLEPAAAHWGRWPQAGGGHLDPVSFPAFDALCEDCTVQGDACPEHCDDYYLTEVLTDEQYDYIGWLNAYEFLEDRHIPHVEEGPALLVNTTVADGRLPKCVATRTAEWLLGREMTADDELWIDGLADDFIASDFRYRGLVKGILQSDNYARVR